MTRLDLTGLTTRPAQVWGGIRLVPLVRAEPMPGLRLHAEIYAGLGAVALDDGTEYLSYVPHGFVADWSGEETEPGAGQRQGQGQGPGRGDGQKAGQRASYGTQLGAGRPDTVTVHRHHRMVKRRRPGKGLSGGAAPTRCRFLPLHLALEGYLALHFGGPSVAWEEWSRQAVRQGFSPREEEAYLGLDVRGLADALRVFEIHPGQCGVLVHTADSLAAAFVVPHPDDYRALHPSLLQDLYGELVHQYAHFGPPVAEFEARISDRYVTTLADLRARAVAQERLWSETHEAVLARKLLTESYASERVYRMGPYELRRFLPPFRRGGAEQHIGELITDHKGRTAYLKTFRLSDAQIRRGHLLSVLAAHDWRLDGTAAALGTTYEELVRRIRAAGFAPLLNEHVVARRMRGTRGTPGTRGIAETK
ncbi:ARPP-2 domain-containing protein [Streptomyces sp. NPDC088261]|uniref:ARPP-2 domain-containing protein n=1 Tax=Streptomyces sp. NPDC088261 TaxID=3365851 RepID=UPI003809AF32